MPSNDVQKDIYPENRGIRPAYKSVTSDVHSEELRTQVEDWLDNAYHNGELNLQFSVIQEISKILAPNIINRDKSIIVDELRHLWSDDMIYYKPDNSESWEDDMLLSDRIQSLNKEGKME